VTDSADALVVRVPTVSDLLNDLVRKRWVIKRRSVTDTRIVHLRLSWQGQARAQKIEQRVAHVNTTLTEQDRRRLGMVPKGRRV
jgi:DNA-binding MarR family transcriptional regulator